MATLNDYDAKNALLGSSGALGAAAETRFVRRLLDVLGKVFGKSWKLCIGGGLLFLLAQQSFAQSVPPMEYCYVGTCHPSLSAAESAMRNAFPQGYLLQHAETESAGTGAIPTLIYRYELKNVPPTGIISTGYSVFGWSSDLAQCAPAPPPLQQYCASEEEAINNSYNRVVSGNPECSVSPLTVSGSYVSPFRYIYRHDWSNALNASLMVFNDLDPGNKRVHFEVDCPWGFHDSWDDNVDKFAAVQCGPGFRPRFGLDTKEDHSVKIDWPNLCESDDPIHPAIISKVRQVNSCPANSNPCHPATGDKSRAEADFEFAGRKFVRHYHSLKQFHTNWFAAGWSHSYSDRVFIDSNYLLTDSGVFESISLIADNTYRVNNGNGKILKLYPNLEIDLFESNGDIKHFDSRGYLSSVTSPGDPSKNVTLTYVEVVNTPVLVSVNDASGRSLKFEYEGAHLARAIFPDGQITSYEYDLDNLIAVTYSDNQKKSYHYSETGSASSTNMNLLTGITAEGGQRYATFKYDSYDRVVYSGLHAQGGMTAVTELNYLDASRVEVTTESGGTRIYRFSDDLYRSPLEIANTDGAVTSTYFDNSARVSSVTDKRGVVTQYGYQPLYLSSTKTGVGTPEQRTIEFDRNTVVNRVTERRTYDANNGLVARTNWTYNGRGQALTSAHTDPATNTVRTATTTYCEQAGIDAGTCPLLGLVTSVNGPRTDVTDIITFTYYPSDDPACATAPTTCPHRKGDVWKVTNALGQISETLKYDGAGRALSVKNANGVITDLEYHPRGWLIGRKTRGADAAVETDDAITRLDYWPTGLIKQVTQPDGAFTTYAYDAAQRLTAISDNAGNTISYTLDNAGNRTQEDTKDPANALKRTLSRVFNQLGQLQILKDASLNPTSFSHDANGNTDTVTDALGRITDHDYDPLGRLSRSLQNVSGINAQSQFQYDTQDNLTQVTDPKGLKTNYNYNGLGDLIQLTSPDTGVVTYTYDSAGNRKTQKDALKQTSTYTYDALNRLTGIGYATTSLNVVYTHDSNQAACAIGETFSQGRLTRLADASGNTQYCYDRFGNLVRKVQTTNGIAFTVRYAYTLAGQLSSVTYPDGAIASYLRDTQGHITQVNVQRSGSTSQVLLNQASYHPFGPVAGWVYGNGRQLLRPLNKSYQPTAIQDVDNGGLSVGFQYDPVGNLTQLTPATNLTPLVKFDYDALDRLTKFRDGATDVAIESYAYDATGNRQSFINAAGTQAYTYPATSHRLSKVGGVARTYDAAGNTTGIGGNARQFVFDATGRMSQVQANRKATMNYLYNGKGEQVRKYLSTANTYTVYDEVGHWLGDYDSTGAALQQAIWLDDLPVGLIANGNQLHYVEADHLGTPRVVIEVARNVPVWTWDLKSEAFGNSVPNQNPDGDANQFVFNLRFPGQRYDANTGLNYNYFRDGYEPATGRYSQPDPIGLKGGVSIYGYAKQSPLGAIDPSGLAAYLVPLDTSPDASIYCVDGVIRPYYNYDSWSEDFRECKEVSDCIAAHEMSHVADANRSSPGLCRRGPLQWMGISPKPTSVTFSSDPYPGSAYSELDVSEFKAHTVELYCLMSKLRAMNGQCDLRCKDAVIRRMWKITHEDLPDIKDGSYGR